MKEATLGSELEADRAPMVLDDLGAGLALILDEMAHGVVVVSAQGRVLHANQAARQELARRHTICIHEGHLQAADTAQSRALLQAVGKAGSGRRSMVVLRSEGRASLGAAVLPLRSDANGQAASVALVFSRAAVCEPLMLCFFARTHGLTNCEEQVLSILCQGYSAPEIALHLKVAVSTVRSHVRSLCAKTQSNGVRALVGRVAVLPPLGAARLQERVH
ncbi:MAG: transcriptional regulator, LuxR family-like protein [Ramlibacter sp.]|jgi:DNA-binding CsgD family transcriptional regulator|nr:transcriptional regulator, LuxR family-like protein [Ramlibacter sp.]